MKSKKILFIYTTIDSESKGKSMIRSLLDERLIGCGLTAKADSQYHWLGEITTDNEWVIWLKTILPLKDTAIKRLTQLHPYEIPCILHTTMKANTDYLTWLKQQVDRPVDGDI